MISFENPYLLFVPKQKVCGTPKDLLKYCYTVRTMNDWIQSGFKVKIGEYNFPNGSDSEDYDFEFVMDSHPEIDEAIKTQKKATRHPYIVSEYFLAGVSLSEFIELPKSVIAYCEAKMQLQNGATNQAIDLLKTACQLDTKEVRYRELYYQLALESGNVDSIFEEFEYFKYDIDSIIHSGRFKKWMKAFLDAKDFLGGLEIIRKVELAISAQIRKPSNKFYGIQHNSWYLHKKDEFENISKRYTTRFQKMENNSISAHEPKRKQKGMKMSAEIPASNVAKILYDFIQITFGQITFPAKLSLNDENQVFHRLSTGEIGIADALSLPDSQQHIIYTLFTQYVMFLTMNEQLKFPKEILNSSTSSNIGSNLLSYICEYRWPFPQLLNSNE